MSEKIKDKEEIVEEGAGTQGSTETKKKERKRHRSKERWNKPSQDGGNDPSWYATDPQLLKDFASYPFSFATGLPVKLNNPVLQGSLDKMVSPGFTIQWVAPTIGLSQDINSPVNVAGQYLYSNVRSGNSGGKNYDPVDMMLYCLAMSDIYSAINWLQRIYGIARMLYTQGNRYFPSYLLYGEGIDVNSIVTNLANFRGGINVLIHKAASLAVPGDITLFSRRAFMYKDLYKEGDDIKDQAYMFSPTYFYQYGLDSEGKGMLDGAVAPGWAYVHGETTQLATYDTLLNYVDNLIGAIYNEEDLGNISGDIIKRYGSNVVALTSLPEDYRIEPIFNIVVLEQMANATVIGQQANRLGLNARITQVVDNLPESPYLVCPNQITYTFPNSANVATSPNERATWTAAALGESKFLTTSTQYTGPELVIENSRLMLAVESYKIDPVEGGNGASLTANMISGTEMIVHQTYVKLYYESDTASQLSVYSATTAYPMTIAEWLNTTVGFLQTQSVREAFKFNSPHHTMYFQTNGAGEIAHFDLWLNQDLDNYTVLHAQDIKNLHDVAIINLFNVPFKS